MLVRIMYQNDKYDMVKTSALDELISSGRLKKFHRSQEWVTLGVDPVRGRGGLYKGPERRKNFLQSIRTEFWT